jgi:hypothetical protein
MVVLVMRVFFISVGSNGGLFVEAAHVVLLLADLCAEVGGQS